MNKDGTGLTTVFAVDAANSSSVLAIDESYVYFFDDTYEHQFYRGVDGNALYFTTFGQSGDVWKTKK